MSGILENQMFDDVQDVKVITGTKKEKTKICKKCKIEKSLSEIHEMRGTQIHNTWKNMKQRCFNKNGLDYMHYGGRGITVCRRWRKSFLNFFNDMGEKPKGLTLDRVDNNKGYFKGNCKWSTWKEQQNNRRPCKIHRPHKIHVFLKLGKHNKTGYLGVCWDKGSRKYRATIKIKKKYIHLGYFKLLTDAITARKAAEQRYWDNNYEGI